MTLIVDTAVTHVTVYPDRARVVVAGTCELETGLQRLIIDELPLTLENDSVRVKGVGQAQVRILGVDVTRQYYEETPAERLQTLLQQLEQIQAELQELNDNKAGWEAHGRYLTGLREATTEYAKGLSRGKTSVEDQTTLITFLQTQDSEMRTAVREIDAQHKEAKRRLDKVQKEINQLRSARPRERNRVQIEIDALTAGSFAPEISYVVRKAGWQPLYDVRLLENGNTHTLDMTTIAQITQNTGQDWQGVELSVSTARPSLNQRLPDLKPWFVDEARPPVLRRHAKPAAAPQPMAAMAMADAAPEPEMEVAEEFVADVVTATVQDRGSGTAVTFNIPGNTDIPSDGSPHKTTLQQFNVEPELDYLSIPKHTDSVFRRATVVNATGTPLLAGQASLFVGDEYIGSTRLGYTAVNDEIELLLGVEESITVEREMVKRDVDKKMLRDQRRLRFGFEINLKNLLKKEAKLVIEDHIPVSRHESIKIKLEQAKPNPKEQTDLNLLEWELLLMPASEQNIQYEFSVEYPRSMKVAGLTI